MSSTATLRIRTKADLQRVILAALDGRGHLARRAAPAALLLFDARRAR